MLKWIAAILALVVVSGLLLFMVSGFGPKHRETVEQHTPESIPESIRDLPIINLRETDGDFFDAVLQEATLINGFPCNKGSIQFTKSGQLAMCSIAEDIIIHDNLFPKYTLVQLNEELEIVHLLDFFPENTEIQGFQILRKIKRLGGTVGMPAIIYPSGRLKRFYSPSNVSIHGIPCRRSNSGLMIISLPTLNPLRIDTAIQLHENGNVQRCTLSEDAEIDGLSISAGSKILLSEDGEVTILDDSPARRTKLRIADLFD